MRASSVWGRVSPSAEGPHSCPLSVPAGERRQEGDYYEQNEAGLPLPWSLNGGEEFLRHPADNSREGNQNFSHFNRHLYQIVVLKAFISLGNPGFQQTYLFKETPNKIDCETK